MSKYLERYSSSWSEDSIRFINTPGKTAKSIYFYLQEVGYFKTEPPYFTERANLNSFLIVYTLSGEGKLHYLGQEYSIKEGQCFFINCMEHHHYETFGDSNWEFLWLHFNGANALGYFEEFARNGFKIIQTKEPELFERTLYQLIDIHQNKSATTDIVTSQCIHTLLAELIIQNTTGNAPHLLLPGYLKSIMKYIDQHFSEDLTLDFLADLQNINKYHLSHEFKRYTGMTLKEYIINTRLSHAKDLLKYTEKSVQEIAEECGVYHTSHFINLFKSREGCTPFVYRKEWKA